MSISIDLFKAQLDSMIDAIDKEMADYRRYWAVQEAVARYSVDRPDDYTEDVAGNDGRFYALTGGSSVLSYWVEGFSFVLSVEYPAATIASNETPVILDPDDFNDEYRSSGVRYLYFHAHSPGSTETMRIKYSQPYYWIAGGSASAVNQDGHGFSVNDFIYNDGTEWVQSPDNSYVQAHGQVTAAPDGDNFSYKSLYSEVPQIDFFAVCNLAACIAMEWLAAKYAKAADTTIGADSTTHTTRTTEFSNRSKEFCKLYSSHMGLDQETKTPPAGDFVFWETEPNPTQSRRWLFHNADD